MKEIILQGQAQRLRAAVIEEGELMEVFEQEGPFSRLAGNIYLGRVENVLPGMQAAFVDIGLDKNAFLYVQDAVLPRIDEDEGLAVSGTVNIQDILKPRQQLLVQVIKEPLGNKGARITTNISLPGRYVVLLPQVPYMGVSRKIQDSEERERLKEIVAEACPVEMGIIIRTLAQGLKEQEIIRDIEQLAQIWSGIQKSLVKAAVPGLVYQDLDLTARLIRDFIDEDVEKITLDQEEVAVILRRSLQAINHPAGNHVLVISHKDLFADRGINEEIRKALLPKVWLKNGGYLIINQTEALFVIDVNTGKYVGKYSLQETVLDTNLHAARMIARQLRLRNLGGIIIIDFIDMVNDEDKQQVLKALEQACESDKIKCNVVGLTKLGLVEITRKKVGQTLAARYTKRCSAC
ncbi:MAG TPA: Rne/Rng family ribonuclease, partial [Desulfitobacteriaceae bacterium]|nr:Rne/Rng family ribonuclease [Desulfitobacteriaceae bacterium]